MNRAEFDAWLQDFARRPLVMGVLNVTPDSFSDGGRYADPAAAADRAAELVAQGADLLDIGGESTRPGAARVPAEEQARRIVPVLRRLPTDLGAVISVDTTRAGVADAALDAGAAVVNDISGGLDDPAMLPLVARQSVPIVLMHMRGEPATMQSLTRYDDVTAEVREHLAARLAAAVGAGIVPWRVLLDPGIGFAKGVQHNLTLLRDLPVLASLGRPLVLGTSRKGFLGRVAGEGDVPPAERLFSTAASVAWCVANGAAIVRVHDVGPMARVVRVIRAIRGAGISG